MNWFEHWISSKGLIEEVEETQNMFAGDSAIDPLTGQSIGLQDPHYQVVNLYYKLLAIYQPEFTKARDNYLNRVWHDYAVLLLQTAEALNITTRPPGFKSAPIPPLAHTVTLTPNYTLQVSEISVCSIPPDPDPATQVIQPVPGSQSEYKIVTVSAAGKGSGGLIVPNAPAANTATPALTTASVLAFLKALSPTDLNTLIAQLFGE